MKRNFFVFKLNVNFGSDFNKIRNIIDFQKEHFSSFFLSLFIAPSLISFLSFLSPRIYR